MAYGNWGAFVYRAGERMPDWEDQTPFKEREYEAGYGQAFGLAKASEAILAVKRGGPIPEDAKLDRQTELGPHHAVLGEKDMRLCGYKCYPRLYWRGEPVELEPFVTETYDSWTDQDGNVRHDANRWAGEIEGFRFEAEFDTDSLNMIDLKLVEPDGTEWTSRCGYCYGSGWES